MIATLFSSPLLFFLTLLGLVIAITIHEFSHALAADKLGDPTPRSQGRLTLNPLAHLDPLGTITLLIASFGWGKPVPFDTFNLTSPRRDSALISLAGPSSNLILAILISILGKFFLSPFTFPFLYPLIVINISLAIFNLLPIYPLDGAKIVSGLLPRDLAFEWESITTRYGTIILTFMIFPFFGNSPISAIISPLIQFLANLLI
jgi:Zn-dependent protease